MIELTVKTLDSLNHTFNVEAESTVEQLKQKIRESLGLEIDRQRLIFCGRVLQDDQKLNECGVDNGKCLHLVQRPPPSPPSRRRERERERQRERENTRGGSEGRLSGPLGHHIRHLLSAPTDLVIEQQQAMSMTPTAGRMEFIRRMITEIRESMARLRSHTGNSGGSGETAESQPEAMDTDSGQTDVPTEVEGADNEDDEDNNDAQPGRTSNRNRTARAASSRYSRPRDLGQLLEELDILHEEFAPYRLRYINSLRDLTVIQYPEPERAQRQRTVTMICDIMHSFAHGYHAISDITFHVGQRYPRLTSEPPTTVRHPLPMQAQINVVTTTGPRRAMPSEGRSQTRSSAGTTGPAGTAPAPAPAAATASTPAPAATPAAAAGAAAAARAAAAAAAATATAPTTASTPATTTATTTATATSTATTTATATATAAEPSTETFNVRRAGASDGIPAGTPIHTTTRTFSHPSSDGSTPLHYRVEIETRGHIAIPFDNSLLNGLAAVASNLHQAQAQQDLAAAAEQRTQIPPSSEPSTTPAPPAPAAPPVPAAPPAPAAPAAPPAPSAPSQPSSAPSALSDSDSTGSSTPPHPGTNPNGPLPAVFPAYVPYNDRSMRTEPGSAPSRVSGTQQRGQPPASLNFMGAIAGDAEDERPRLLMELENLLRVANHGGGVEVMMSMEEMPFLPGTIEIDNNSGVFVGPIIATPAAAAQTTEMLHSVIANVLRQNIGDALMNQNITQGQGQAQGQRQTPSAAQSQSQNQSRGPTQNQEQNPNQAQTPAQDRTPNQRQTPSQGQTQNRPNQSQGSTTTQEQTRNQSQRPDRRQDSQRRQQWQVPLAQTSRGRTHSFAMACMVYDRYMHCDSVHARRHLQERREHYQEQAEAQERARAARQPAPEIGVLMDRNPRFLRRHMNTMRRLLSSRVGRDAQLNAFMTTIARHQFLDPMNENPNDPTPMPNEFPFIRMQLREYVQHLLELAFESGSRANTFEAVTERVIVQNMDFLRSIPREYVPLMVELAMLHDGFTGDGSFDPIADHLVQRHTDFLCNMHSITSINPEIDPTATLRVMIRSRLPAIIACVMSEASSDMFAARFYSVLARFFTDICTLFLCFCLDGFEGLLRLYDAFMQRITSAFEESSREWLRLVARENLLAVRDSLEPNIDAAARQYFRRADGSMPTPAALRENMNISIRDGNTLLRIGERTEAVLTRLPAPTLPAPPTEGAEQTREDEPSSSEDHSNADDERPRRTAVVRRRRLHGSPRPTNEGTSSNVPPTPQSDPTSAQERPRAARTPVPEIEVLLERNPRFTQRHMTCAMRLLSRPDGRAAEINAFFIAISRHLLLSPMDENPDVPPPMPSEFPFIHMQMRTYIAGMLERAVESRSVTFDSVVDYIMLQSAHFLSSTFAITRIHRDAEVSESFRTLIQTRLPTVISCIMTEIMNDTRAARLYIVLARFFTEVCSLFLFFCVDGFQGLMRLFDVFIGQTTATFDEASRDWLRAIGRENLLAIRNTLAYTASQITAEQLLNDPFAAMQGEIPPSDEEPTAHDPQCPLRHGGDSSSSANSPSEPRSPGELNSSDGTPRLFRDWPTGGASPAEPRSAPSELDSANLPGGIITIGIASSDNSSLFDPDENNDDDFIDADGPDDYEFIEMQRTLLDTQLNLLEDEEENDDVEVDVETDDGVPVNLPGRNMNQPDPYEALSAAAMRMRQSRMRHNALLRAANRLDPEQYRRMRETDLRMEIRAMDQSARETEADAQLMAAIERLQQYADSQNNQRNLEDEADNIQPAAEAARPAQSSLITQSLAPETVPRNEPRRGPRQNILTECYDSEYSTPPADNETSSDEQEFLEPNAPNESAQTSNETDSSEPEFLTPIAGHRQRVLNSLILRRDNQSNNEINESSLVDHFTNTEDSEFPLIEYHHPCDDSNCDCLPPYSRYNSDVDTPTPPPLQPAESSDSAAGNPPGELDDNIRGSGDAAETPVRNNARLRDNLTPPPATNEPEALTRRERPIGADTSIPQHTLVSLYTEPLSTYLYQKTETKPPATQASDCDNQRVAAKYNIQQTTSASTQTPMNTVFENFESSWEPVFREDGLAQERAARPQEPFSDAYLSGMPSRKRRCLRESRPEASLDGLMNEGLRAVSEGVAAAGVDSAELRQFLRESVRTLVRQRSQQEPDNYSPAHLQNTAAFLEPTAKPKTKEPEEQNPKPPPKRDTPPDSVE